MKYFLTLIFSVTVLATQGQTIQYLENNPEWRISRSMGPCIESGEYNYFLNGDTIINGKQYKKVFSKGYMQGLGGPDPWCPSYYYSYIDTVPYHFLRQDNKKLYCINAGCNSEILLYDFSLNQNDTFKVYWSCDTTYFENVIVESVDSILIDTDYRRVLHFGYSNCGMGGPTTTIIEGIGTEHDFFAFCNGELDGRSLQCYGVNGISLYPPSIDSCDLDIDVTGLNNESSLNDNFNIYPNPVNEKLTIINPYNKSILQIDLLNSVGQKVLTRQNSNTLNISSFNNGIYFLRITFNDLSIVTKKIIKN